jgi:hypothetical protein
MKNHKLIAYFAVFVCVLALTSCDVESNKAASQNLTVSGAQFTKSEFGGRHITGTVQNNGTKTCGYAQVSINLYGSDGRQVGSTIATINNLEPGKSWNFDAAVIEENATSFKVMEVSGI